MNKEKIPGILRKFRYFRRVLIFVIMIGVAYIVVSNVGARISSLTNKLEIGVVGHPQRINPLWAADNPTDQMLSELIYKPLISFDDAGNPQGVLAESWEISDEGKTYTLNLREDIYWQDGATITADDVVFTYEITTSAEYDGPEKDRFRNVDISARDARTVVFVLQEEFTPFLSSLNLGVIPKHIWETIPLVERKTSAFNVNPVGSTTFEITDVNIETRAEQALVTSIVLKNNYRQDLAEDIDNIVMRFYDSEKELMNAFVRGDVDVLRFGNDAYFDTYNEWPNTIGRVVQIEGQKIALMFNEDLDDTHPVKQKSFKQGVQALIEYEMNAYSLQNGPIPASAWAYTEAEPPVKKTAEELTDLLNVDEPLRLVVQESDTNRFFAQSLVNTFDELGVLYSKTIHSYQDIYENILPEKQFDILVVQMKYNPDPDQYVFWHSSQTDIAAGGLNLTGYTNRQVDKVLEEARTITEVEKRKEKYAIFQDQLREDLPAIFVDYPQMYEINRINVTDLTDDNTRLQLWYQTDYLKNRLGL